MREAVVVSTARTGLAKSHRGGFNNTGGVAMSGHAIKHSIERAGIEPAEVDEVVVGCGTPQGTTGNNIGRLAAIKAFDRALESGRLGASGRAEANYRLGEIYVALGHRERAVGHFREAAKVAPSADWGSQSQAYLDLLR